jgi:hypothetical protein
MVVSLNLLLHLVGLLLVRAPTGGSVNIGGTYIELGLRLLLGVVLGIGSTGVVVVVLVVVELSLQHD